MPAMLRHLIEIQHSNCQRTLTQLNTLLHAPELVCGIIAVSPQTVVGQLGWGALLHALIVHEQDWYLLRDAPITLLNQLSPRLCDAPRIFFIDHLIPHLSEHSAQNFADYLVRLPPSLLSDENRTRLQALGCPLQGTPVRLMPLNA
ncbi:hypothetical protein [Chitinibacter sp. ZOR0017]|uniref:hypothetical protein n=2 Tax=Chitinibacter TaxID=230666 RepID=UPI00064681E5|nr:hypothetical protein [Chitinibacter sp. ZOR0017]